MLDKLIKENYDLSKENQALKAHISVRDNQILSYKYQSRYLLEWILKQPKYSGSKLINMGVAVEERWNDLELNLFKDK